MMDYLKIGISACLIGKKVRYDGSHKQDHYLTDTLGRFINWIPLCPEVEAGLPIPRKPMHLEGDLESPRIVLNKTREDITGTINKRIAYKIKELKKEDISGFIFKSGSPSCGIREIKVYDPQVKKTRMGKGIFALAFMKEFPNIPVEDEKALYDPHKRENFLERVVGYKRWVDFKRSKKTIKNLIDFHSRQKYNLMAHSQEHLILLGRLVASAKDYSIKEIFDKYEGLYLEALTKKATPAKHYNTLQHIIGYLKKHLIMKELEELREALEGYRKGKLPLIIPITLINHYVRMFNIEYLKNQYYLNPEYMMLTIPG